MATLFSCPSTTKLLCMCSPFTSLQRAFKLTPNSAFDGVVNSYHELAAIILQTLHLEVRCHVMYHVNQLFQGSYRLDQLFNEPDPDVLRLNSELSEIDEEISGQLMTPQHE